MQQPDESINPEELPQKKVFRSKEVNQYPQPADTGKALEENNDKTKTAADKEANKTKNADGLNEENSAGNGGAFEGFEDQGSDS